ncbi:energy transducer TonB [Tsuneonella amylolytica]|uniref:energy transducer TonB n=1 Tax=Tsuneonella amylolytica TaxID=2338327 RepID=UPI0013C4CF4A|nr:energy transducer TonB [Tsuneonella amylolytica]
MFRFLTVLALAGLSSQPLSAAEPVSVYQPASKWNLDFGVDQCSLRRSFGTPDDLVAISFERFQPGDSFSLLVTGKALRVFSSPQTPARFEPDGREIERAGLKGEMGKNPALVYSSMTLDELGEVETIDDRRTGSQYRKSSDEIPGDPDVFGMKITPEREAQIDTLVIGKPGKRSVRLALGSMGKPMAALRTCVDDLVRQWGIDVEAHRSLTRSVIPLDSPAKWIGANQYPLQLLRNGDQGLVYFRLIVEPDGTPSKCHIQATTRAKGFDDAVCAAMMRSARFDPALDASGAPIRSYWSNTVLFQIP